MRFQLWHFILSMLINSSAPGSPESSDNEFIVDGTNEVLNAIHNNTFSSKSKASASKNPPSSDKKKKSSATTTSSNPNLGQGVRKCPSLQCNYPLTEHHFGPPSRLCPGPSLSGAVHSSFLSTTATPTAPVDQLSKTAIMDFNVACKPDTHELSTADATISALQQELQKLSSKEGELLKLLQSEESILRDEIAEKQASLAELQSRLSKRKPAAQSLFASQPLPIPASLTQPSTIPRVPEMLQIPNQPIPTARMPSLLPNPPSLSELYRQQSRSNDMLLRPVTSAVTQDGKPLLIPDFVMQIVPTSEEKVLSTDTDTRLLLSVGNKKPKLSNISVEQYSIANLRIFHELLSLNRLPTMADIREYLSYSIKIYELARKYSWLSVLQYDNEFRVLQHMYGYPWSMDHSHIHETMLIPRWAVENKASRTGAGGSNSLGGQSSPFITHTS